MSSISSSTSTSSSASTIRGFGGLSSGLDRDTLIENMTAGTRAKIAKQKQEQQIYQWKQEAYRSVSSKLVEFSRKYMSYTNSSTNLSSSSFWARSSITALGANSKYVSVSGTSSQVDSVSIVGVKQLAKNASMISTTNASNRTLETGVISTDDAEISTLEGGYLSFKYGSKTYNVSLSSGTTSDGFTYDYSNGTKTQESVTKALKNVSIGDGKTLADVIEVTADDPGTAFKLNFKSKDTAGNTLMVNGGSEEALKAIGFSDFANTSDTLKTIDKITGLDSSIYNSQNFFETKTFSERISGKNISFTYNGTTKSIKLADNLTTINDLVSDINTKLGTAFGTGRIDVSESGGKLSFVTKDPATGADDTSSILSITSADKGVIGKSGVLNVSAGESNRLNLNASLADAGLANYSAGTGDLDLMINGVAIEGLTHDSTISQIMDKVNESNAGVTISYMKNADKFSIVSTVGGAAGKVIIDTDAASLFGTENTNYKITNGQDAIVGVKYAGSDDVIDLVRGNNSFDLDGLNISVNGTFGYDTATSSWDTSAEAITFNAKTDTDKIVSAVKDMVEDYNEIIELVNKEVSTKPNRDYEPLTDEQKEEMKDEQIEKWDEKAKAGMLFNDSDLRSLSDSLRFILAGNSEDRAMLEDFGISTSSTYGDNGKLVLEETKFKAALESNPDDLQKLFTKKEDATSGETGGVMANLMEITEKYAATSGATKGILIERAGSTYAPTSILSNSLQKSLDSLDDYIDRLKDRLETETDRYVKQFTNLETIISQMNSQSSYLSSLSGS